jgi:autotransporter-associated beta strand protein
MQDLRAAHILAGGAIIDTNTNNVTIAQALAGSVGDGGLTKKSAGILTLTGALTYTGLTDIQAGTLQINTGGGTALASITGAGALGIGNTTSLTANSVSVGTLTIGAGSTLTINAIPGGPMAGGGFTAVPEPSTFAMLAMAALGLMAAAWRRRK